MSSVVQVGVAVLASYLVGSIPFGVVVGRARGIDVRRRGSGNIGATNVARNLGKKLGALVLLLDALKGALPVAGAAAWGLEPTAVAAVGVAAVVGHCAPIWLGFRGGKGVATSLGVLLVIDPPVTALAAFGFALVVAGTRMVSLGSLVAVAVVPLASLGLGRPASTVGVGLVVAVIVTVRHWDNIRRILRGTEHRFR